MDKYRCRQLILRKRQLLKQLKTGKKISIGSLSSEALTCLCYLLHFISNAQIPISRDCHNKLQKTNLISKLAEIRGKKSLHSFGSREKAVPFLNNFSHLWPNLLEDVVKKR